VVFGKDLAIARAPNSENPGGSLLPVSRGEEVDLLNPELEVLPVKLSEQKKMNQRILEISDAIDPRNSSTPEALIGQGPNRSRARNVRAELIPNNVVSTFGNHEGCRELRIREDQLA
jgi:hypothetical protein